MSIDRLCQKAVPYDPGAEVSSKAGIQYSLYDDVSVATGHVILLNVDLKVHNLLSNVDNEKLSFDVIDNAGQLFIELEKSKTRVDALVIGVKLIDPVRIAQRVHSLGKDIPLLILSEPEHHEQLKQALKFAPFLGNDVMPWSTASLDQLLQVLMDTVRRAQKRRAYQLSLAAAQKSLGDVQHERPQVRQYLDRLLDHAPIGVLNVDIQGAVLGLNRCASQILKLTEREALGNSLIDIFPPSERESLHDLIAQCVAPERHRTPEVFDVSESVGIERYVEIMASSLVDRSGQLGATIIMQDVTARVRAEQERSKAEDALRISEGRYRELVQTMSEALALTDNKHRITFVNDSFCRMFGYSSEDVINKYLLDFVHDDDREMMAESMANPVQSETVRSYETAWKTSEGDKVYTLTSPKQIFDPEIGYVGCLGIFTDITERKKVEQREKKHMIELAHVSRVTTMGEMSSQIAHELAQPLSAINALSTGCLKMLKSNTSDHDEIIESLSDINQQANRAREIVLRLRNFVRNQEMQYTDIELNELVRTVVHLVEVEARWHNVPVILQLQEPLAGVLGDRILVEQVVLNLVHNAIEAMRNSEEDSIHQLTISTALRDDETLQVDVIDTGPGIKKSNLKKIFEPFFSTKVDGMGMGLAITRSIVEAHGGHLMAKKNKYHGMTFCFTLPVNKQ